METATAWVGAKMTLPSVAFNIMPLFKDTLQCNIIVAHHFFLAVTLTTLARNHRQWFKSKRQRYIPKMLKLNSLRVNFRKICNQRLFSYNRTSELCIHNVSKMY